jgi:hypothetical protein
MTWNHVQVPDVAGLQHSLVSELSFTPLADMPTQIVTFLSTSLRSLVDRVTHPAKKSKDCVRGRPNTEDQVRLLSED